VSHTFELG